MLWRFEPKFRESERRTVGVLLYQRLSGAPYVRERAAVEMEPDGKHFRSLPEPVSLLDLTPEEVARQSLREEPRVEVQEQWGEEFEF